jgi:hypothetical protein
MQSGLFAKVDSGATFSPCRRWRYRLWRQWDNGPTMVVIGLNPSTADERADDPTIRRCIAFAKQWSFGRYEMLNLFAWRSTDSCGLFGIDDPVGPDNDRAIVDVCRTASRVVLAWGRFEHIKDLVTPRAAHVMRLVMAKTGCEIGSLGVNGDGTPKHPLYLPASTRFVVWASAEAQT